MLSKKEQKVRQTLRRPEKIRKKKDFDRLFRERQVARGTNFRVHYLHREHQGLYPARAAFVAGKRIGNSVTRNRIKRLLREAFRRIKKDLKPHPMDLAFVANRDFSGARSGEVMQEMRELLERAGVLEAARDDRGDRPC